MSRWLAEEDVPEDRAWRPPKNLTKQQRAAEQDEAAGGRDQRLVHLDGGEWATASVELKRIPTGRRIYAYLRFFEDGKTVNRYLGDATSATRQQALRLGWSLAKEKRFVG